MQRAVPSLLTSEAERASVLNVLLDFHGTRLAQRSAATNGPPSSSTGGSIAFVTACLDVGPHLSGTLQGGFNAAHVLDKTGQQFTRAARLNIVEYIHSKYSRATSIEVKNMWRCKPTVDYLPSVGAPIPLCSSCRMW